MNKKLIYTSIWLCLGGLALGQVAWAKSGNGNSQAASMKKCPFKASDDGVVVLTRDLPHFHYDAGDLADIADDVYQRCEDNDFTNLDDCESPVANTSGEGLYIFGSNRSNTIEGSPYVDHICGNNGNDTIDAKEDDDFVYGNNGSDHLSGGLGDDHIYGANGRDEVWGYDEENDDLLEAELDDLDDATDDTDCDILDGGNGGDILHGGPNGVDCDGTPGDLVETLNGGNGPDDLNGGDGDDDLNGGNGPDDLNGGLGDDTIDGGKSKDDCIDDGDGGLDDDCQASEEDDD